MGFQHPQQLQHKRMGMMKAAQSPMTPAHLKPHLLKAAKAANLQKSVAARPMAPMNPKKMKPMVQGQRFVVSKNPIYG